MNCVIVRSLGQAIVPKSLVAAEKGVPSCLATAALLSLSGLLLSPAHLAAQQFQPAVNYTVGPYAGTAIGGIPIDVNNDGNLDLIVVNEVNSRVCSVLLGNGDGTFQPALTFHTAGRPIDVAAGDFNLDGNQDLAVLTGPSTPVESILLNTQ